MTTTRNRCSLLLTAVLVASCGSSAPPPQTPAAPPSSATALSASDASNRLAQLDSGAVVQPIEGPDGFGIQIAGAGLASARQLRPLQVVYDTLSDADSTSPTASPALPSAGYRSLSRTRDGFTGSGRVPLPGTAAAVVFNDVWQVQGNRLRLLREMRVQGNAAGGLQTAMTLDVDAAVARDDVNYFMPATVYGGTDHIQSIGHTPFNDFGSAAHYGPGYSGTMQVREDRLPAPLLGLHFADGHSLTVLNAKPDGASTQADSSDTTGTRLVDARFRFGALAANHPGKALSLGYYFPGSEGETAYVGAASGIKGADSLHRWMRREHPVTDGLTQRYELVFTFAPPQSWRDYLQTTWRAAWDELQPPVFEHPTGVVRKALATQLQSVVTTGLGGTGFPMFWNPATGEQYFHNATLPFGPQFSNLGFLGRSVENAAHLIVDAQLHPEDFADPAAARASGLAVIETLRRKLPMNPPISEGIDLTAGLLLGYPYPDGPIIHLRSLGEDFAALLQLYQFEKSLGHDHSEWLAWGRDLGDFLLTQQAADGSIPRAWTPGGIAVDRDSGASFYAVTFLLRLSAASRDQRYFLSALKTAELALQQHRSNQYWGATTDHSGSVDKEAAAFSLRAYLELYQTTGEARWLESARQAANTLETWVLLWNVPMGVDAVDANLTWDRGVSTVGLSFVATGGSGVDNYQSECVDDFARLYELTGDDHYLDVARLFLHNSYNMVALPGNLHRLIAPGWSYEYWSLALGRGTSGFTDWVPWINAAMLQGLLRLELDAPKTYQRLTGMTPKQP